MTTPEHDAREETGAGGTLDGLGQVAGELIHDMANLVAVLEGRLRVALGETRAGRAPVGELERAVEGCTDLGSMLRDILETVREESLSPEVVMSPEAVTERAIRRVTETCRPLEIRLVSMLPEGTAVRGRASFLYRAVANLLANAARHAVREIRVTLSREESGGVLLSVEDDGAGIPPERRAEVFRPLVRGGTGGTGLGLSSVDWTVRQLRGEVSCSASAQLGGARFDIHLPVAVPLATAPRPPRSLARKRVLVVDDNPDVRRALGRFLRRLGAHVVEMGPETDSADKILRAVIRAMPDALLLDLDLGLRTGVDLWKMLHEELPPLAQRVVFLSGFGPRDRLYEAARATGQRVLPKPFDFDELADAVQAVIRDAESPDGGLP